MKTRRAAHGATLIGLSLALVGLAGCVNGGVNLEARTFELEYLSAREAEDIIEPYVYENRTEEPGVISRGEGLISVRETADNLDRIERVLEQYDRPREGLQLHFQLVEADGFGDSDPEIADVEDALRDLFRFEGYRLAASGVLTVDGGYGRFLQSLSGTPTDRYQVSGTSGRVDGDRFRLEEIGLNSEQYGRLFATSVVIRPGQTLVLGSAGVPDRDGALILIVRAASAEAPGAL